MNYKQDIQPIQSELFANLLENEKHTDVCFIVGQDKKEFKLNRVFLAAISPVWDAMLYGHMKESEPNAKVMIADIHPIAFESVVKFAYNNNPKLTPENVLLIQQICDKYQIKSLLSICDKYILKNTISICKSDVFMNLSADSMQLFLKSDYLNITEETLWEFVLKWATYQCKPRQNQEDEKKDNDTKSNDRKLCLLKSIRKYIRFGIMDAKYFAIHIVPENILTSVEVFDVFCYYHHPKAGCGDFNCKVRQIVSDSKATMITYKLSISKKQRGGYWATAYAPNTAVALMNANVNEGCATADFGENNFIQVSFDCVMMITKIEIGGPGNKMSELNEVKYINGRKLQYKDKNDNWIDVRKIQSLEQNIIHEIKVNVKTMAMRVFVSSGAVGIGTWRVFGCVTG